MPQLPAAPPVIEFRRVRKAFDATLAVDDVSFSVAPGEVHALLGANGAGKSTLIKLLAGVHQPDGGEVLVQGQPAASSNDVVFIHQDLGLIDTLTVAENIAITLGYSRRGGLIDWHAVRDVAREALVSLGSEIAVEAEVGSLSRADQSVVAIARAVSAQCKAIVLDEPTASLSDADVERLFGNIRRLSALGVSVIYVTHRLDEVFQIANRVVVLRDGRVVANQAIVDVRPDTLVGFIVGDATIAESHGTAVAADAPVTLRLHGVALGADAPRLDLDLRAGEILGLAGLRGAGQEELGRGIAAIEPLDVVGGELEGQTLRGPALRRALAARVGFVSSRREAEGLAMTMSVRENMFLNPGAAGRRFMSWLSPTGEHSEAQRVGVTLALHPNRPELAAGTLSGGNQQKVVLGRELAVAGAALVLEEPTMGIDVGARADIYALIRQAAARGVGFLIVSSNFEELALLCHRVLVLDRGAVVAELAAEHATVTAITEAAAGRERVAAQQAV